MDISRPLTASAVAELNRALHEYKVIFFRDQQLDHASQIAFARRFGELTYAHPHDDEPRPGATPSNPCTGSTVLTGPGQDPNDTPTTGRKPWPKR